MEVIIALLALGAYMHFENAKKFIDKLHITLKKGKLDLNKTVASGFTKVYITIYVNIANPTEFTDRFESMALNVYYKGTLLGKTSKTDQTDIHKGDNVIELPVAIPTLNFASLVEDVISKIKSGVDFTLQLKGNITTNLGTLTINEPYKVSYKLPA